MAQGFVKSLNLFESNNVSDAGIFNNLAGAGIVPDLVLFAGNLKEETRVRHISEPLGSNEIYWEQDADKWIYIKRTTENEGTIPFSNRTYVKVAGTRYVVSDSDTFTKFKIRTIDTNEVVTLPVGEDIVRSEIVNFTNITNMSRTRLETQQDATEAAGGGGDGSVLGNEDDIDQFLTDVYTIEENFTLGENAQALFFYKKGRIPRTYEESIFDRRVVFDGAVRITNDSDIAISLPNGDSNPDAPGLYIVGASGDSVRAFSDTSNPWTASGTEIVTTAQRAQAAGLKIQNPNFKNVNSAVFGTTAVSPAEPVASSSNDPTYKMKVSINGETYYLILKDL